MPQGPLDGGSSEPKDPNKNAPQSQPPTQCFKPQEPSSSGQIIADVIVGFGDAFLIPILVRDLFDISGDIDYGGPAHTGGIVSFPTL